MADELPAVIVPLFGSKAGLSLASPSSVVSGRITSSKSNELQRAVLVVAVQRDDLVLEGARSASPAWARIWER